jgi:rubrerythrin
MPTLTDPEIVDHLNDLRQLDYDAVQTYEIAIGAVDEDAVREDLAAFKRDHERHITDLGRVIAAHGGTPEELSRDVKGVLLEGLTKLRSVTGTLGALKAMRMNEQLTNRRYDEAVELALPADVLSIVSANREDERRHLAAIESHIDRIGEGHEEHEHEEDEEVRQPDDIPHAPI